MIEFSAKLFFTGLVIAIASGMYIGLTVDIDRQHFFKDLNEYQKLTIYAFGSGVGLALSSIFIFIWSL